MNIAHSNNSISVIKGSRPKADHRTKSSSWDWKLFVALFGLVGGITAAVLGSIFTATTWITGVNGTGGFIHTLGTECLFLTIPLLIVGAHCFDLEEKSKRKRNLKESHLHEDKFHKDIEPLSFK